jgi:hypothetical protein
VFTARYGLIPYINQITLRLLKVKSLVMPSIVVTMTTIVSSCYKTLAVSNSSWNLDLECTQAPCWEGLTWVGSRPKQRALAQLGSSSQRGAVLSGSGMCVCVCVFGVLVVLRNGSSEVLVHPHVGGHV